MIPKTIHYFWFGGGALPKLASKCLESWKRFCPDYEIKRWDESNLDLTCNQYVKEASEAKKWSLVTDFFRFKVIHDYGGIYLDTDVELVKPLDDLLRHYAYMGIESTGFVNTGSGFGAESRHPLLRELVEEFERATFSPDSPAIFTIMTEAMRSRGYVFNNRLQTVGGATIYPMDYFAPIDLTTRKMRRTRNTYSIHHYIGSWAPAEKKLETRRRARYCRIFGDKLGLKVDGVTTAMRLEGGVWNYAQNRLPRMRGVMASLRRRYNRKLAEAIQIVGATPSSFEIPTNALLPAEEQPATL